MREIPADLVVVGRLTTVYGVRGWVKLHSYTEPMENILGFDRMYLQRNGQWQAIEFEDCKRHQKGLVVQLSGVADRDAAKAYCQCDLAVPAEDMPPLETGDYYWHQLEGLKVYSQVAGKPEQLLGQVDHLMETGANDVVAVKPCEDSIDKRERLIPWLPDQVVKAVDLDTGRITVDWDSEF